MSEIDAADQKTRLTLWVDGKVKEELKRQARELGISASAYVSIIAMQRKKEEESDGKSA